MMVFLIARGMHHHGGSSIMTREQYDRGRIWLKYISSLSFYRHDPRRRRLGEDDGLTLDLAGVGAEGDAVVETMTEFGAPNACMYAVCDGSYYGDDDKHYRALTSVVACTECGDGGSSIPVVLYGKLE
jgi:hypothetical protein